MNKKNFYYQSWVTFIQSNFRKNGNESGWKFRMLISVSSIYGIALFSLLFVLKLLFKLDNFNTPDFHILPLPVLNGAFSFFLVFIFPFVLLNYLLIFFHNRYKKLILKHKELNVNIVLGIHLGILGFVLIITLLLKSFCMI